MAVEEVEEHVREVVELQKMLNDTNTKNEFQAHHLEIEHADAMKLIVEANEKTSNSEKQKFENAKNEMDRYNNENILFVTFY